MTRKDSAGAATRANRHGSMPAPSQPVRPINAATQPAADGVRAANAATMPHRANRPLADGETLRQRLA